MNIFETILKESEIAAAALEAKTEALKKLRVEKLANETRLIDRAFKGYGPKSEVIDVLILVQKLTEFGPYKFAYKYGFNPSDINDIMRGKRKYFSLITVEFFLTVFGPEILKSKS